MRFAAIFLVLFTSFCFSQTRIDCYNSRLNEFIKGYPNVITVVSDEPILEVTTNNGTIEKGNGNKYTVITGDDDPALITVRTKSKTQEFPFRNREPAPPIMTFGGEVFKETDSILAKRFRVLRPGIWLMPDAICSDVSLKIARMTILRIDKNKVVTREVSTDGASELMKLAEAGDTYIFMDVKIELQLSSKIFWAPITRINIKD